MCQIPWEAIEVLLTSLGNFGERHALLHAVPGTGKSRAARRVGVPPEKVFAVNFTDQRTAFELRGYERFVDGDFKFFPRAATLAWKCGVTHLSRECSRIVAWAGIRRVRRHNEVTAALRR